MITNELSKYPPAEPEALRLRALQRGVIATGRKILNIEPEISNRRSKANPHFEIRYSLFDILRFKISQRIRRRNVMRFHPGAKPQDGNNKTGKG